MDKEIGIGLRTRVEKNLSSREPLALDGHSCVTSPLPQLESAQNQQLCSTTRGGGDLAGLPVASNPEDSEESPALLLGNRGQFLLSTSLICPACHPALLCRVPASQADGKGWLQRGGARVGSWIPKP